MIKWGIFYFPVVTHTILIADHDIDRPPQIAIALLIASPMVLPTLFRSQSLVVVHTNLFAITYLIADQDLDHLLDRDLFADSDCLADRGLLLDRLIANVIFSMPITPSPGLVPFACHTLTRYRRSHLV